MEEEAKKERGKLPPPILKNKAPPQNSVAQISFTASDSNSDRDFTFVSHGTVAVGKNEEAYKCVVDSKDKLAKKLRERLKTGSNDKHGINIWWLLLDSEATNHVFCNRKLVNNFRYCPNGLIIHGHSGSSRTHYFGAVNGIKGRVWIDPDRLANIISQSKLSKDYRITYDNWEHGECFLYTRATGQLLFSEQEPADYTFMTLGTGKL